MSGESALQKIPSLFDAIDKFEQFSTLQKIFLYFFAVDVVLLVMTGKSVTRLTLDGLKLPADWLWIVAIAGFLLVRLIALPAADFVARASGFAGLWDSLFRGLLGRPGRPREREAGFVYGSIVRDTAIARCDEKLQKLYDEYVESEAQRDRDGQRTSHLAFAVLSFTLIDLAMLRFTDSSPVTHTIITFLERTMPGLGWLAFFSFVTIELYAWRAHDIASCARAGDIFCPTLYHEEEAKRLARLIDVPVYQRPAYAHLPLKSAERE